MAQVIDSGVLDNLDGVDAAFHGMFTERNGKFEFDGVGGLKTQGDIDRLSKAAEQERSAHRGTKEKLSAFDGLDGTTVHGQLDRIKELELAAEGKLDEEGINKLVESRIATKTAPLERNITKLTETNKGLQDTNDAYAQADIKRGIMSKVTDALKESKGFNTDATEDVMLRAERLFELNEDGSVTAKDNVGITPGISPSDWLVEMQTKAPHWWGESGGGGARPGSGGGGGGANPWTAENWNITEQNKLMRENRPRADQLAATAGTKIGGLKPAPKK